MALSFKSIKYNDVDFIERVDSKFYFFIDTINKISHSKKMDFVNLEELILNITDGEHAGQKFVNKENGVLFLKNSSIKDYDISLYDGFYITKEKHAVLQRSALKKEDVLFTTIGHIGSSAIVPENFGEANMNQNFIKMTINKNKINPFYLTCYLNSKLVKKQLLYLLTGNIQSLLTYPKIKSIKIAVPKDKKIYSDIEKKYLEAVKLGNDAYSIINDTKLYLLEKLRINASNIKKVNKYSVNYTDFYNGDLWTPKYHFPLYNQMEKYLNNSFSNISLGEIASLNDGDEVGSEEYNEYLDTSINDIPFIRTSDIYNFQIDLNPDYFINQEIYFELKQDVKSGDIIFSKDGKIGEIAMITSEDKCIISSGNEIIRINDNGLKFGLTQEYLFCCLMIDEIGRFNADRYTVTASTIPHLKEEYISKFSIPIIDKKGIDDITLNVKNAISKINKKKQKIKECQDIVNNLIENA